MITQILKSDCGCEFEVSPLGQVFHWCPLHKAASAMYEALKDIGLNIAVNYDDDMKPIYQVSEEYLDKIKTIIAKAKGKV